MLRYSLRRIAGVTGGRTLLSPDCAAEGAPEAYFNDTMEKT